MQKSGKSTKRLDRLAPNLVHVCGFIWEWTLMCHYTVAAKDDLPESVETYPFALVCNTHNADQPGEHWVAMYVDEVGDYFDLYGEEPQHIEFANYMNEHCSEWSADNRTLRSPLSTVCGQYCVVFLTLRCHNVSMHAFSRLFTTDLVANDCLVFDLVGKLNRKRDYESYADLMSCCRVMNNMLIWCSALCQLCLK